MMCKEIQFAAPWTAVCIVWLALEYRFTHAFQERHIWNMRNCKEHIVIFYAEAESNGTEQLV
jgi:hypothetical protein